MADAKDIRDKAEAMRAYAKQAKNKELEIDAAEIRMRAERKVGELKCGFVIRLGDDELTPTFNNSHFHMPTGQSCGLASGEAWSKITPLEKLPGEAGS